MTRLGILNALIKLPGMKELWEGVLPPGMRIRDGLQQLANVLAVLSHNDWNQMEEIIECSWLYNKKWNEIHQDGKTWGQEILASAIRNNPINVSDEIEAINQKMAVVKIKGMVRILEESINPISGHREVNFLSVSDCKLMYTNKKISTVSGSGKPFQISIFDRWLECKRRREYKGVIFSPGKDVPGYYNLFQGLSMKPVAGDWNLTRNHLLNILCNGNQEHYNYLLSWMARIVQDPGGTRPGTAVVLRGEQGTGKGVFVSNFGKIFGAHFVHITNMEKLVGRFNSHLQGSILVYVDEAFWGNEKRNEGVLKAIITEDTILLEPKGIDAFPVKNHANLIIASNSSYVVPAGFGERRFFVLDVSNEHRGDRAYFNDLVKEMENGGREAMLYDLLRMDLSGIDLRTIPRTDALFDQVVSGMNSVDQFWYLCLCEGRIRGKWIVNTGRWPENVETGYFYESYKEHTTLQGKRGIVSQVTFGQELKKLLPAGFKRRRITKEKNRVWVYILPDLQECRRLFEEKIGQKVDWEAP